jgi:DNA modification methylase
MQPPSRYVWVLVKQRKTAISIEQVAIDDLRPDPANPRRISDAELESLTRSIQEFGLVDPVIARREDKMVIGGHQRLLAARRLGHKTVPVVYVDLSPEKAQLLNVALNRISGDWDKELLARLLADLDATPNIDLSLTGFADDEITKLLKSLEVRDRQDRPESFDVDAALKAAQSAPVAKTGDLWLLGDHRLLCGDSTRPDDLQRLMDGQKAVLMATDPPYLVDYTGGTHPPSRSNKPNVRDKHWDEYRDADASVEFFKSFLTATLPHLIETAAIYQWHAFRRQALVEQAWTESGLLVHQQIIWAKSRGVLTRSHYMWRHEPCFYGWREGKPPKLKPPTNETSVWDISQDGESLGVHPTQKPTEIFQRPISYHTEPGDICLEPFLGSGTQVIAVERLARRCNAIEKEPVYVDVAIKRWEAFTGGKAEKAE